jgi:hypothetical protein
MHLAEEHLPAKLASVATDRLATRVPKEYLKCTIASALASRMVYQEGIQFIEMQDPKALGGLAFDYLKVRKDPCDKADPLLNCVQTQEGLPL